VISRSQALDAYERLKFDILNGVYRPEFKLKIDDLGETFSVSPGAVREALSRLTSDGLVEALPQRGFRVSPLSVAELRDLTEVRVEIETRCLRRAIEVGDVAWEGQVLSACHQLSKIPLLDQREGEPRYNPDWALMHMRFHEALVAACDSPWWLRLRRQLYIQSERYRCLRAPYQNRNIDRDVQREHEEIAEAAIARDTDRALPLMTDHLQRTADIILGSGLL
jgi:DNA-binding GntR family transcriptional regulator